MTAFDNPFFSALYQKAVNLCIPNSVKQIWLFLLIFSLEHWNWDRIAVSYCLSYKLSSHRYGLWSSPSFWILWHFKMQKQWFQVNSFSQILFGIVPIPLHECGSILKHFSWSAAQMLRLSCCMWLYYSFVDFPSSLTVVERKTEHFSWQWLHESVCQHGKNWTVTGDEGLQILSFLIQAWRIALWSVFYFSTEIKMNNKYLFFRMKPLNILAKCVGE